MMKVVLLCVVVAMASAVQIPLVILPGLLGSVLEAQRVNATGIPWPCDANNPWEKVWVDIEGLTIDYPCWKYCMELTVNRSGYTSPNPGISVRNPLNHTYAVACLDPANSITCSATEYLGDFLQYLYKNGYIQEVNVAVMPFDFRISPLNYYEDKGFFHDLAQRIETLYAANNNTKVALLGHSMGGFLSNLFLNTFVSTAWKQQYIAKFISVASPFGGAPKALRSVIAGESEDGIPLPVWWLQPVTSTWVGLLALFPNNRTNMSGSEILVTVGSTNYGVNDLAKVLSLPGINLSVFGSILDNIRYLDAQSPPGVPTVCLIGYGFDTEYAFNFSSLSGDDRWNPVVTNGPGDSTVPAASLEVCATFSGRQPQPVSVWRFNSSHEDIISSNTAAWATILAALNA